VLPDLPPLTGLGSRVDTCHLMQQMPRDPPRHLCGGRPTRDVQAAKTLQLKEALLGWEVCRAPNALGETLMGGDLSTV